MVTSGSMERFVVLVANSCVGDLKIVLVLSTRFSEAPCLASSLSV